MAPSYTTNSGIEKPLDGEQTGSWGDTVNLNMDIIDRSLTGVGSITLSGTTHTLTTTDGTLTDGQYRVLVLGGTPSGTNTITVSPNDQTKLYFVVNNSGQDAVFTQGSGGNVTVANNTNKMIYADGAGAGAAVVDFTDRFAASNIDINGGTIDNTVIGGSSAAAATVTTLTASGDIVLGEVTDATSTLTIQSTATGLGVVGFSDGTSSGLIQYSHNADEMYLRTAGTLAATFFGNQNVRLQGRIGTGGVTPSNTIHMQDAAGASAMRLSDATNGTYGFLGQGSALVAGSATDVVLRGETGNNLILAIAATPKVTINATGATFAGDGTFSRSAVGGTVGLTIQNSATSGASAARLHLDVSDSSTADPYVWWSTDSTNVYAGIDNDDSDKFKIGNSFSTPFVAFEKTTNNATFAGDVTVNSGDDGFLEVKTDGLTNSAVRFRLTAERGSGGASTATFTYEQDGGAPKAGLDINADNDSIYLSTSGTTALTIDSSQKAGIGTSSPSSYNVSANNLVVYENGNAGITIASNTTSSGSIYFADGTAGSEPYRGVVQYNHASDYMRFLTQAIERVRIDSSGNVGIGTSSPSAKLDVNGTLSAGATTVTGLDVDGNVEQHTATPTINYRLTGTGNVNVSQVVTPLSTNAASWDIRTMPSGGGGPFVSLYAAYSEVKLRTENTDALTIDSSQNATFAGDVLSTIGQGSRYGQVAAPAHQAGNAGSVTFGVQDGAGMSGLVVTNSWGGTFSSQTLELKTALGGTYGDTTHLAIDAIGNITFNGTRGNATFAGRIFSAARIQFTGYDTYTSGLNGLYRTAADGLVLAGSGSSTDFILVNDVGQTVLSVPTGTQNTTFAGHVTATEDGTGAFKWSDVTSAVDARLLANTSQGAVLATQSAHGIVLQTNATERVRIDSSGNVGIGTTSISSGLTVSKEGSNTTDGVYFLVESNNASFGGNAVGAGFKYAGALGNSFIPFKITAGGTTINQISSTGVMYVGNGSTTYGFHDPYYTFTHDTNTGMDWAAADTLTFKTGGTERMRITSSGDVGIGTTSPDGSLNVQRTAGSTGWVINAQTAGIANDSGFYMGTGNHIEMALRNGSGTFMAAVRSAGITFFNGGNVGIGTSSPSYKLHVSGDIYATGNVTAYSSAVAKDEITTIPDALDLVEKLRGVSFKWKDSGKKAVGLIYEEVKEVIPELTSEKEGNVGVAYQNTVALLIEAVKTLSARVKELESK